MPDSPDQVYTFADEHENGQLRLAVVGEQIPLLPLPDDLIPTERTPEWPPGTPTCKPL